MTDSSTNSTALRESILGYIRVEAVSEDIQMDTKISDVEIDSIDVINAVFAVEEELDIRIGPDIEISPDETVGDLIDKIVVKVEPGLGEKSAH